MWDPQIGPGDIGLGVAAFIWGFSKLRERLNGGSLRERLIRIETNQESVVRELADVKSKVGRLESLQMGGP